MGRLKRVVVEVHRRSLWQVLGIYIAASWAALQAVDVLAETANLPVWFPPFALALLIIGLPVVLATAFVQEGIGNEPGAAAADGSVGGKAPGVRSAETEHSPARALFTWRNALIGGVAAFALWGVLAAGWLLLGTPGASHSAGAVDSAGDAAGEASGRASIAVLPFAMRSAVGEDSFFVQGVHDDILTQLAGIEALKVISRTSVMRYAGTEKSVREIAGELGVATLLEGGVQRAGGRIRVTAQLIDAETDAHLWAENYEEALTTENLFAIQTRIARAIVDALEARLTPAEEQRLAEYPTENLEAYELYSRARYLVAEGTTEKSLAALDLFREAAELDPEFAEAHALFASTYLWHDLAGNVPRTAEARGEAREAVRRALALDPDLARAHLAHGAQLEMLDVDLDGAERAYRHAIELSPSFAAAHFSLGFLFMNRGRFDDARSAFRRAVALDPRSIGPRLNLAFTEYVERDYVEAERQASRVVEMYPRHHGGYYVLSGPLGFQDRHDEAIGAARRAVELNPSSGMIRIQLAFVHARAGNRDSALVILDEVATRGGSPKEIALVHGALGDLDRAFEYLEIALERGPGELATLDIDPSADPLRDDPRYRDILRRAGLEAE